MFCKHKRKGNYFVGINSDLWSWQQGTSNVNSGKILIESPLDNLRLDFKNTALIYPLKMFYLSPLISNKQYLTLEELSAFTHTVVVNEMTVSKCLPTTGRGTPQAFSKCVSFLFPSMTDNICELPWSHTTNGKWPNRESKAGSEMLNFSTTFHSTTFASHCFLFLGSANIW